MTKSIESFVRRKFLTVESIVEEIETVFKDHELYACCSSVELRNHTQTWPKSNECCLNVTFLSGVRESNKQNTYVMTLSYFDSSYGSVIDIDKLTSVNPNRTVQKSNMLSFEAKSYYECAVQMLVEIYRFIDG